MNDEWKRFLLQWMAPVGVFGVALVILFSSFNSKIKSKSSDEYDNVMISTVESYADALKNSVRKAEILGNAVSDIIVSEKIAMSDSAKVLSTIVDYSDAYMSIICDKNGKGYDNSGKSQDMESLSYYSDVLADAGMNGCFYVSDDEITGAPAIVLSIKSSTEDSNREILVYYPIEAKALKKNIPVESDFDVLSFVTILDKDGNILANTGTSGKLVVGKNVWDEVTNTSNASLIRRVKTKLQSGNSGVFEPVIDGTDYYVSYTALAGTDKVIMLCVTSATATKAIAKISAASSQSLGLIIATIVLFVLVITALNIAQIYISSKNKEDLKDRADTDQLTGLKNKIATEREIKEYIENHPDSLAMMFLVDIDNFKKINDTMGHAFGDEVLRELGRHIGINFRVSDVIGRTGGDEFTIFLKNLKEDANALREAQKLVYFFKHFQVGDYVKYTVTASIGAAVFPAHGADFETLYKAADAAVYKSKKRGKNQLSFYDDRDRTPEEVAYADAHQIDISRKEETPIES